MAPTPFQTLHMIEFSRYDLGLDPKVKCLLHFSETFLAYRNRYAMNDEDTESKRGGGTSCKHPTLALITTAGGYLTGKYRCTDCGETFKVPNNSAAKDVPQR